MRGETLFAMTKQASSAQHGERGVVAAAQDLRGAARVATPHDVLDVLDEVAQALGELASACEEVGPAVVPRPRAARSDWRFYRDGDGSPGPLSHEQKALALSTLHDLGASIRTAAWRCRDARATLRPVTECLVSQAADPTSRPTEPLTA
jgi:hypothetical protein